MFVPARVALLPELPPGRPGVGDVLAPHAVALDAERPHPVLLAAVQDEGPGGLRHLQVLEHLVVQRPLIHAPRVEQQPPPRPVRVRRREPVRMVSDEFDTTSDGDYFVVAELLG